VVDQLHATDSGNGAAEQDRKWYVIHTYSGYENKVKTNLEHRIESMGVQDKIFQVVIPTEEEIEIRDGQRRTVSKKIFPGYVLVQMIELKEGDEASNKAWYVVRNTPGVTGFVGSGAKPVPLDDNEVKQILRQMGVETPKYRVAFQKGQSVRVTDGPFAEFIGTALLLIAVIGSGIAAQSLSPGDVGLELLENAVATGAALVAIILAVGPVSGAHLNPVVSAADAVFGGLRLRELAAYVIAQVAGAVVGVLGLLGIPYTGSSCAATSLCLRKHLVNTLLDRAGLPVPRWGVVRPGGSIPAVGFPAICKPAAEDGSLGVEQRSVVRTGRALAERVDAMHTLWDEVLVQRFIDGREVNVGIVGDQVLPISEVNFAAMPRGMWRIVSYRSKWEDGSDEDRGSVPQCPADLPSELVAELGGIAVAAWRLVGGDGYGRVDLRIDRSGRPWVLEVNANPDAAPDDGLARMALAAGLADIPATRRQSAS